MTITNRLFGKLFSSEPQTKQNPLTPVSSVPESQVPFSIAAQPEIVAPVKKDMADKDCRLLGDSFSDFLLEVGIQDELPPNHAELSIIKKLEQFMAGDIPDSAIPRLPAVGMMLIKELADKNVTQECILDHLKQDPAITLEVLRMANSPSFRVGQEPIENLDRAVLMLGFNTLRMVINVVLFKDMMNIPPIYFKMYGQYLWKHSVDCAQACQTLSKHSGTADPFNAYIVGLLHDVGKLIIFRLLVDTLRKNPDINPRGCVFSNIVSQHSMELSIKMAIQWDMPDYLILAFEEQTNGKSQGECSTYGFILKQANAAAEFKLIAETSIKDQAKLEELLDRYSMPVQLLQTAFPKESETFLAMLNS
ncbi:MAG: HDOD domain-containing protein [Methylobacter sp.]